jgi:hypothetical protein
LINILMNFKDYKVKLDLKENKELREFKGY